MTTPFDAFVFIGILLCMLFSSEPKKSAIARVLYLALIIRGLDYFFDGWLVMNLVSIVESMGAILLLSYARSLAKRIDRVFFRMMSAFLLMSAATVPLYRYDFIYLHADYVAISHAIALCHLAFMGIYSDGIRLVIRNLRNNAPFFGHRSADSRG